MISLQKVDSWLLFDYDGELKRFLQLMPGDLDKNSFESDEHLGAFFERFLI